MRYLLLLLIFPSSVFGYVPTVESLFRHGPNPEVSANGVTLTLQITKINTVQTEDQSSNNLMLTDGKNQDFYKLYFTRSNEIVKLSQTRYENNLFSESSLNHKIFYSNLSPFTFKRNSEEIEKSLFLGVLISLVFNDGEFLVNYLKTLNVPVKLNKEIINKEKVELLAAYKRYLVTIGQNRSAKKTEINPLMPEDVILKEKVGILMSESMYVDQKQVSLQKDNGQLAWQILAGNFEAVISYNERRIQKIKYLLNSNDYEVVCKDYWLANGTHSLPKYINIKDFKGESFQIEILNLRHYMERDEDLVNRHKKWDQLLKGKESLEPRPAFML